MSKKSGRDLSEAYRDLVEESGRKLTDQGQRWAAVVAGVREASQGIQERLKHVQAALNMAPKQADAAALEPFRKEIEQTLEPIDAMLDGLAGMLSVFEKVNE